LAEEKEFEDANLSVCYVFCRQSLQSERRTHRPKAPRRQILRQGLAVRWRLAICSVASLTKTKVLAALAPPILPVLTSS